MSLAERSALAPATQAHTTVDQRIAGPHGEIPVRVYRPQNPDGTGLVWLHGGAFYLNDIDVPESHWVAGQLADSGTTVVTVDYRLASDEIHFPVLTDECLAAWRWANASGLPVEPGRFAIGGGSAGANLAASVALQLRDAAEPPPSALVLIYPPMHSVFPDPSPWLAEQLAGLPDELRPNAAHNDWVNLRYAGRRENLDHPYVFPGMAASLAQLPRTLVVNSEVDYIRPSGERFAAQLAESGVDVTNVVEPGVRHGHLNFPDDPGARRTVARVIAWLAEPRTVDGIAETVTAG